jgi:putative transposase
VVHAYSQWKLGATFLERIFKRQNTVIHHNLIQRILNEEKLGVRLDKKVKRKDWVRYERKHSNAMWHTDWTTLDGRWLIAFQDDASRKIVAWGVFDSATTKNSITVLEEAIKTHGTPKSILTGRDVQFYSSDKKGEPSEPNDFQKRLSQEGIEHVLARVNHPQTNGKIERFFGELKRKIHLFSSPDELVHWYNEIKPHMSLDWENLETPSQAFRRKMHHKQREELETLTLEVKQ